MSEKEGADSVEAQEYEDDFEKDLDWLINEDNEADGDAQNQNDEEQANDLRSDTNELVNKENGSDNSYSGDKSPSSDDAHGEPNEISNHLLENLTEYEENDIDDEEAKRYIAEKIEEANKQLEKETIDEKRERKLKFKDNLVDLEVPPLEYAETDRNESCDEDVVDSLSRLHFSDVSQKENHHIESRDTEKEKKNQKFLVEKDGKFELLNLSDMESQHFLPPINNEREHSKSPPSTMFGTSERDILNQNDNSADEIFYPKPPSQPKARPSSAANTVNSAHKVKSPRRVQSASLPPRNTTYSLSPEQKQLQKRIQERQEKLKKEEEERRKAEEENKKKENEIAFKSWLLKKKDHLLEERRIQQAKQLENTNTPDEDRDPGEAYRLWLRKKHKDHLKEKKMDELKKLEAAMYIHERDECERAFAEWLRRKRMQKRAEHQAAKERSRRLLIEARRIKHMHNLLYNISDSKTFRYVDSYS
ncbi:coiled-coil domain-containing protein 181 [Spea bombifrons]|uniref:coiled-coil domain-containing protein 181 n=1 Tax=Spea bombifrons TaxID=233779 RepID=UPI0023497CDF|nr:coiled-coil domain-containing protein 181 [Spea bombifrons]XP_053313474.1 coiled-coil domain-containing protein 181 [Spea bombifrons]